MSDKFEELEESKWRNAPSVLAVLVLIVVVLLFRWSGTPATQLEGVVESGGALNLGKVAGGTREVATVRLDSGRVVAAYVVAGGPLSRGDHVSVLEETRIFGGPAYQVVAKQPAQ
jgi:hypothetical protein